MKHNEDTHGVTGTAADILLALYPKRWRRRYEDEYRGVLEQCPPSFVLMIDVCRGALGAHLTYRLDEQRREARRERAGRQAAIALCWKLALCGVRIRPRNASPYRPLSGILS